MYVFSDRQALKYPLMAIYLHTGIMSKPIGLLVPFDANMGLDLDNPNILTRSQALSHGLYSGFQDAKMFGLSVQAWAPQMLAQHVHGT